ncbi:E1-E2 ATPase family protein (macronuclear) [Tetrahymena thermophila SB210]|uniref:E1-E2 ATPase family protein n=1 Tax=Tetrahymena thermophila (strain SB210) TaxID=312017 RepID=Q23TB9_TETTS|nr:E1-E2 ATPase family protein [Tetrahymena thermophila SB210]EAR99787.2 E1-E2 ATPase family protein [Tetrahymena thermophila SB210]|eukprot:XP_001020032.2 E1-E2 ATPase family protein [Tetrahymena thermophila SB210]
MIRHPTILKSQVEGDLTIKQVEFLRLKRLTFYLVTIFSFGISSIVCYFNINLKKYFFYSTQNCIETSTHVLVQTTNDKFQIEKLNSQIKDRTLQTYFLNRKIKYFYDQSEHSFQALQLEIEGKKISEIAKSSPQDPQEIEQKIQLFGKSFIEIKVPSYFEYMGSQMFQPMNFIFYFGQLVLLLQLFYSFFAIALSAQIIIMSIIYIFVRKTKQQLKEACMHDLQVQVQRSNGIQTVSSTELVPGDIIIINQNITLPFDCILLEGQMQVNEANITGESIPVIKSPLPSNSDLTFKYENQKSQVLLEGTSIIKLEMDSAKALVVRTSLSSFKGQIIRALLYPKPFDKRFVLQGAKFSLLMVLFCSIAFFCVLYQYYNINLSNWQITLRYLDMIQFCVPPAVPIIINAMIFFGLMRLKTKNILGSDPMKQIQAGRIQTICFDKTGTLTENFVEIIGYSLPQHENLTIVGKDENSHSNEIIDKILGICHQASASDDQETIVGDPIDIQMVQFSGWTIGHDQEKKLPFASKKDNKLYSLLVNEFHSEFQSMSVVSQDTQKNKYYLFIKGSPEVIISRCHSQEQKEAYLQKLHQFAVKGYRVLGLGYKELSFDNLENFIKMQRSDQEKDICFSGFLIFKNNLKKDTKQVIEELKQAELKIKIISGDNPITTIKIAEECSILKDTNSIILLDHAKQQSEFLNIYEINEEGHKTEITFQGNQEQILQQQISFCVDSIKQNKSFCMTGSAQSFFQDRLQIPKEHAQGAIQQQSNQKLESFYKLLILHSQIFARTSPEQKALVVKQVKELGQNVCMVGDGANDCSAIREADIGISFSDADGQFSAPYISKYPSIECVKQILLEGRAVLQTSREIFKGYIQIGILRFMCFLALSYFYSGLGDFQMTWQGYIFGYTMNYILYGLSKPVKNLQKITIDDDFFGIHTLISMVFSLLVFSCQFVVILNILQDSPNYIPTTQLQSNGHLAIIGQENTLMFIAVLVNYLYIYLSNYRSSPIKQPIFKNYLFFISVLLQALYANIIIFTDKINVSSMNLKPIYDNDAEIKIFFSLHGFGMIIYLFDFIFTKNLFSKAYQKKYQNKQQQITFNLYQKLQI